MEALPDFLIENSKIWISVIVHGTFKKYVLLLTALLDQSLNLKLLIIIGLCLISNAFNSQFVGHKCNPTSTAQLCGKIFCKLKCSII